MHQNAREHMKTIHTTECENCGIDASYIHQIKGTRTARYVALSDNEGDLVSGVADMEIFKHIHMDMVSVGAFDMISV